MGDWASLGRLLMGIGVAALLLGALLLGAGKIFSIGRLPGDIFIQKGNFTFSFPLATSIFLSLLLTLLLNLFFRL